MNDDAFRTYLTQSYDKDMASDHANAILSRCRRIEKELGVDLDQVPDLEALQDNLADIAESKFVQRDLRSALNRYEQFKQHNN